MEQNIKHSVEVEEVKQTKQSKTKLFLLILLGILIVVALYIWSTSESVRVSPELTHEEDIQ